MHLFRPHSLHRLMTTPQKKSEVLSVGAKTYCGEIAKQIAYNYRPSIQSKYLTKGLALEDDAIALYNNVFFTNLQKNTERRENEYLSGECDLYDGTKTRDIKCAWSRETFPAVKEDVHCPEYEWQGRAYMMLWDCDEHEVAYCLMDTPDALIGMDDIELHRMSDLPMHMRVTNYSYQRDASLEAFMIEKMDAGRKLIAEILERIKADHPA